MSIAAIQSTVNLYTLQESDLTNQLSDILTQITRASGEISDLSEETGNLRAQVKEQYEPGTDDYKSAMENIQYDYELELAEIQQWESQLETEKSMLQTELEAISTYKESFKSVLKQNVQSDFKYGDAASSS